MEGHESKIGHQKDGIKPKVPLILSHKLEAMKRRRSDSSLSNKMLLKDGSENGSSKDLKSSAVSSQEPDDDSLAGSAKVAPIESMVSDNGVDKETSAMEKLTLGGKKDRPLNPVCPGSPSFRLYLTKTEKQGHRSKGKEELMAKESLSDTNVDAAKEIVESQTSTEELGNKIKKSGKKGMRFRRMIPNGKPVKKFLKVRSCYYPSCVGHKMNQPLITQTPAAL